MTMIRVRPFYVAYRNIEETTIAAKTIEAASKRAAEVLAKRETEASNPEVVFIDVTEIGLPGAVSFAGNMGGGR